MFLVITEFIRYWLWFWQPRDIWS